MEDGTPFGTWYPAGTKLLPQEDDGALMYADASSMLQAVCPISHSDPSCLLSIEQDDQFFISDLSLCACFLLCATCRAAAAESMSVQADLSAAVCPQPYLAFMPCYQ